MNVYLKTWPNGHDDPAWELLSYAFHQRNLDAIRSLADRNLLHRQATVAIGADLNVTTEITTIRETLDEQSVGGASYPDIVYGYLPLYNASTASIPNNTRAAIVAGSAVYELRENSTVTVRQESSSVLRTDGCGTFLYEEVWGSQQISYHVAISLTSGFIPHDIQCSARSGRKPRVTIQFKSQGCRIILYPPEESEDTSTCWLSNVSMVFLEAPEIAMALTDPNGRFLRLLLNELPFQTFSQLLEHLIQGQ